MDRKSLFHRLQHRARERYGIELRDRQPKDWIDERLVPNPIPRGRRREWGPRQYRRTLQICRLKSQGAHRHTDLKWRLWMRGADIPFSRPRRAKIKDVRESIVEEFERRRKQLLQRMPTDAGPPFGLGGDGRPRPNTVLRHIGSASAEILPEGFAYRPDELLAFYDALFFAEIGPEMGEAVARALGAFGAPVWSNCASEFGIEMPDVMNLASTFLVGMGGDPDIMPGDTAIDTIKRASEETFANARDIVCLLQWCFANVGNIISALAPVLRPVAPVLQTPFARVALAMRREPNPWQLMVFVAVVCILDRQSDKGRQMATFARETFPAFRQMIEN